MNDHPDNLPAGRSTSQVEADPIADPGLPAHAWRPTDVDPHAERRAERQVSLLFGLSALCTVGFIVAYFALGIGDGGDTVLGLGASTVTLGLFMSGAFLFIGIGVIQWARKLMSDVEITEQRHSAASPPEDRQETLTALSAGLDESGIGRRPLVRNSLLGAVALLGLPAVVLLRDLGPTPGQVADSGEPGAGLNNTIWTRGMRVARDVIGTPVRPSDMELGDLINAEPEAIFETDENGEPLFEGAELQVAKSKAAVILVRMEPDEITPGPGRENWSVDGIQCYSKICTHVGCPISLYERTTHHLLCPCHQSTFDLSDAGKVIFGPAARALPQLPLMVDDEGYLVARSGFTEPVGPSFWERDSE